MWRQTAAGALLRVKAVPGSARPGIKGALGDALKIALASPPEKGKANRELCALLARRLGIPASRVSVRSGHGSPRKTVLIAGMQVEEAEKKVVSRQ